MISQVRCTAIESKRDVRNAHIFTPLFSRLWLLSSDGCAAVHV